MLNTKNNIQTKSPDFTVIGGGIFGCYAALYLAKKGLSVLLLEKEKQLFRKASIVNQARLHGGYHYPRSVATAIMSDENKARFTSEHKGFINFSYQKYYAVDRFGSMTDNRQFERFCEYVDLKCEPVKEHPLFNFRRLEGLYKTTEYTFDPYLIAAYYKQLISENKNIQVLLHSEVKNATKSNDKWHISIQDISNQETIEIVSPSVVNATYAGSNGINRIFEQSEIELQHEIAEMAFVTSPTLCDIGLTVMDGQFGSLMPYGKSGLHSLSSVAYTHHKVSHEPSPNFDCQKININCRPNFLSDCNTCSAQPKSAFHKMSAQMRHYFSDKVEWQYYFSKYTIKSKLRANHIDDGRPTEISKTSSKPDFYCIFAGKINSIYEIERVIEL
jgi:hypothetical protein